MMGATAENLHDRFPGITKERADAYAVVSQDRVAQAYADGVIQDPGAGGHPQPELGWGLATADEPPRPGTTRDAGRAADPVPAARPGDRRQCLRSQRRRHRLPGRRRDVADELGLPVAMRLVSFAFAGVDPEAMGIGPIPATEKALAKAGLTIDDIGPSRSTRPSRSRCWPSPIISGSPTTISGSIRTAARSPWAIRWPVPACG